MSQTTTTAHTDVDPEVQIVMEKLKDFMNLNRVPLGVGITAMISLIKATSDRRGAAIEILEVPVVEAGTEIH